MGPFMFYEFVREITFLRGAHRPPAIRIPLSPPVSQACHAGGNRDAMRNHSIKQHAHELMKLLFTRKQAATIWIGAVLSTALLFTGMGNAMPIPQYDKMDKHDRAHYVNLLIKGAYDHLSANGQSEQAERLLYLFENSSTKFGWPQFEKNLQMARALTAKHAADPNNKKVPYEVEQALALTLKDNGIVVPVSFLLTINKDFKPSYPPSTK
jgi:hypothetical protein